MVKYSMLAHYLGSETNTSLQHLSSLSSQTTESQRIYQDIFAFLLTEFSSEQWKRTQIRRHLRPFPLQFVPPAFEAAHVHARLPIVRSRLKGVMFAHVIFLFFLIGFYTVLWFMMNFRHDVTACMLQLLYILNGGMFLFMTQLSTLGTLWVEALPYLVLTVDYVALEVAMLTKSLMGISRSKELTALAVPFTVFLGALLLHHGYLAPCRTRVSLWPHLACLVSTWTVTAAAVGRTQFGVSKIFLARSAVMTIHIVLCYLGRYTVDLLERFESFYYVKSLPSAQPQDVRDTLPLSRGEAVVRALAEARCFVLETLRTGNGEPLENCSRLLTEAIEVLADGPVIFEADDYLDANVFRSFEKIMQKASMSRDQKQAPQDTAPKPATLSEAYVNTTERQRTRRASMIALKDDDYQSLADISLANYGQPCSVPGALASLGDTPGADLHPLTEEIRSQDSHSVSILQDAPPLSSPYVPDPPPHASSQTHLERRWRRSTLSKASVDSKMSRGRLSTIRRFRLSHTDLVLMMDDVDDKYKSQIGHVMSLDLISLGESLKHPILTLGTSLLSKYALRIGVSITRLMRFLLKLERLYLPNPYHNALHALAVAHQGLIFLRDCGLTEECPGFGTVEIVSFLAACLGHDAGHPGVNFTWLKATRDPLAVIYSDKSPLEQMHAALVLSVFDNPATNLFVNVTPADIQPLRKHIVELILATDMTFSSQHVSNFRVRLNDPRFHPGSSNSDAWRTAVMCIKAADLGHGALPLDQHIAWSLRVVEEFYQQGEAEAARGIPVTGGFDRQFHRSQFVQSQAFFLICFARPVFGCVRDAAVNKGCTWYNTFEENVEYWVHGDAYQQEFPIPQKVLELRTFGNSAIQPVINLELALVRKARRLGRSSVVIPGFGPAERMSSSGYGPMIMMAGAFDSDLDGSDEMFPNGEKVLDEEISAKKGTSSLISLPAPRWGVRLPSDLADLGILGRSTLTSTERLALVEESLYGRRRSAPPAAEHHHPMDPEGSSDETLHLQLHQKKRHEDVDATSSDTYFDSASHSFGLPEDPPT